MSPGELLYMHYREKFLYRHPLPWDSLPTQAERDLWEKIAKDFYKNMVLL